MANYLANDPLTSPPNQHGSRHHPKADTRGNVRSKPRLHTCSSRSDPISVAHAMASLPLTRTMDRRAALSVIPKV